jgi:hypothetical protein
MIVILALSIASADLQCELVVVDVENVMKLGLYDLALGSGAGTWRGGALKIYLTLIVTYTLSFHFFTKKELFIDESSLEDRLKDFPPPQESARNC